MTRTRLNRADGRETFDLSDAELYINRELSQLEFNRRVLKQSKNAANPLLERLKYLCIASSNLDEFFEIRVAGLKQQVVYRSEAAGPDQLTPTEQLKRIRETVHELLSEQNRVLNDEMLPQLTEEEIYFLKRNEWSKAHASWVRSLAPIPANLKQSLNFLVSLEGKDAFVRDRAIVQAPRALPRIINIPEKQAGGRTLSYFYHLLFTLTSTMFFRACECRVATNSGLPATAIYSSSTRR